MQRIGIDVGGTFTDIVVLDSERGLSALKILSTPEDYSEAIGTGLEHALRTCELDPGATRSVVHAFTVATNALLTDTGATVGLITTEGFRDVLEIGRLRMPRLYDMDWDKPRPLVPRRLRHEVAERIDFRGRVVTPLDAADARDVAKRLLAAGVDSIAVCLLHAYANPVHEQQIAAVIAELAPELDVSLSHAVLPEIREFERTSTTVINARVRPVVARYLERLEQRLGAMDMRAPLMVMQSAGGTTKARVARNKPVFCIESGPAAGAVGAAAVGRRLEQRNLIAFDMGGTTAKVCVIENGEPRLTSEMEVGSGISIGQRLLKGGGYLVRVPAIDLAEIGAGGGSIAWIDKGGALRVGPQSAGALPGPACYRAGGTASTVTDANVVLGHLNPEYLLGGEMAIDRERAARAIRDGIGEPLGLDLEEAAFGIHTIVNASMVRAIQAVSSEIGRAPSDFTLFAFGGSGPTHAATLAMQAGIGRVVIPPAPGVFSALGLLFTEVEHWYVQTFWQDATGVDLDTVNRHFAQLEDEAIETLTAEGFETEAIELQHLADLRYAGQSSELAVAAGPLPIAPGAVATLIEAFHAEHERAYGYRSPGETVQFVNLRLRARGVSREPESAGRLPLATGARRGGGSSSTASRPAYFGPQHGWLEVPVIGCADIGSGGRPGPAIVEEYDTTLVLPPGSRATLDELDNVHLELSL